MKINKMAEEGIAPSWAFDLKKEEFANFSEEDSDRLGATPEKLTDDDIVSQRDIVEKCAGDGGYYFYSSAWDKSAVSDLKEYAMACGMDIGKFKETTPEYIESITIVQAKANNSRIAKESTSEATSESAVKLSDPFHLDDIQEDRPTDPSNNDWEVVAGQKSMSKKPSDMSGAVRPLRGGEDYFENQFTQTARGQNSIGNPDAISQYAEEGEDSGQRLKRENEEKSGQRQKDHEAWEQEKVASQDHEDNLRGSVFPTEVMNAQPGLRDDFDITKQNLPEKTEGEKLASSRKARRQSIQRDEVEADDWEVMKTASVRGVSNTFTDSLKKALGKNEDS